MSELINRYDNRATIRWKLLTGASALVLAAVSSVPAYAADTDQPQIWIELGGQLSRLDDSEETFSPKIFDATPPEFTPPQKWERPPLFGFDEYAKITFQPDDSSWSFSGAIRYGRSAARKNVHQQTSQKPDVKYFGSSHISIHPSASKFADTQARNSERHLILDFQAGKDVGLGMFGIAGGSSKFALGVRFAQFQKSLNASIRTDPDAHIHYKYSSSNKFFGGTAYHLNAASIQAERNFRGVGPSLSWNASLPFAGNPQSSELTFDWGIDAALLFGRQRTRVHHQTTGRYSPPHIAPYNNIYTTYQPTPVDQTRSRTVTVPNVGGSAALSFRYDDAKVSFGYKADFFFNAMDGGIDAHKNKDVGFFGPFASVSIGLGD